MLVNVVSTGSPQTANELLPLVYEELRQLAVWKLAYERPGQTLQPTALVHEAYLRLIATHGEAMVQWEDRRHFFAAIAEVMRRILVDAARKKKRPKHGGNCRRISLEQMETRVRILPQEMLAVDEALSELAREDPAAADIVNLHFFAGFSIEQAAEALGISRATAYREWSYARAWLRCALDEVLESVSVTSSSSRN
jgi:RNA polymerase sigma factor (TIGR02999 family)